MSTCQTPTENASHIDAVRQIISVPRRVFLIDASQLASPGADTIVRFLESMGITPIALQREAKPVPFGIETITVDRVTMPRLARLIDHAQAHGVRVEGIAGSFPGDEDIAESAARAHAFIVATGNLSYWCQLDEGKKVAGNGYVSVGRLADAMHPLQQRLCGE